MLEVSELSFRYGAIRALHDVTFHVGDGEAVALIGANGAGKTTLVRCVSGVLHPESGSVHLDTSDVTGWLPHRIVRRGAVQVPEGRHLFPGQPVHTNLLLGGYTRSRRRRVLEQQAEEIYELFPALSTRRGQVTATLSGGEQQMLAIGRALMAKPRLLMLDEPSMGLAPLVIESIFDTLRALKESGLSLLLVEQNARLALGLTDRGYVLKSGEVIAEGASATFADRPEIREAYLGSAVPTPQGEDRAEDH